MRYSNNAVDNPCRDIFHHLEADCHSSWPELQVKVIDNLCSMIGRSIHSTGHDPATTQPHNDEGTFGEDFLDYLLEELMKHPDNSSDCLSSLVAATDASMRFSAGMPIGGSAIASSSQPIPCSDSNSNSNVISKITSIENTGLVDGSMIVEGVILPGGWEWCQ